MSYGQTSPLGYFERMDQDSFDEGSPISAASAYLLRNNLSHLRDQCPQHRLNAVESAMMDTPYFGSLAPYGTLVVGQDHVCTWWKDFPHTWLAARVPTNLDIGVAVRFSSAIDATIRVRVCPHFSPRTGRMVPIGTGPALVDENTLTMTADTIAVAINRYMFTEADAARVRIAPTTTDGVLIEGGQYALPQELRMRIEVEITRTDVVPGSALAKMSGIMVREFA